MQNQKAFTAIELMIAVVVAAILFVASIPDSQATADEEARAFADRMQGDLSYARSLSIADPSDPTVLKVDPSQKKYWLAKKSSPDTPITNPATRKSYLIVLPLESGLKTVEIVAAAFGDDSMLSFDSTGSLDQDTPAIVRVRTGENYFDIEVCPQSASATCGQVQPSYAVESGKLRYNGVTPEVEAEADEGGTGGGGNEEEEEEEDEGGGGIIGGLLGGLGL